MVRAGEWLLMLAVLGVLQVIAATKPRRVGDDPRPSIGPCIVLIVVAFTMGGLSGSFIVDKPWGAQVALLLTMVVFAASVGTSNLFKTKARPFSPSTQIIFSVLATPFFIGLSLGTAGPMPL